MTSDTTSVDTQSVEAPQLPQEWQERAREAARRFNLPVPTDDADASPDELEQRLRQAEQGGGQ